MIPCVGDREDAGMASHLDDCASANFSSVFGRTTVLFVLDVAACYMPGSEVVGSSS